MVLLKGSAVLVCGCTNLGIIFVSTFPVGKGASFPQLCPRPYSGEMFGVYWMKEWMNAWSSKRTVECVGMMRLEKRPWPSNRAAVSKYLRTRMWERNSTCWGGRGGATRKFCEEEPSNTAFLTWFSHKIISSLIREVFSRSWVPVSQWYLGRDS